MFNEASKNAKLPTDCKLQVFQWVPVDNSLLSAVTNTSHFTSALDTGISDFYGHIFQVMYTLCYKHICLKLAHDHDYLMRTTKSKGPVGHMVTNGLYTFTIEHFLHQITKAWGTGAFFLVLFCPLYLYIGDWQNITNFGAEINVFLHGLQHLENTIGLGLLLKGALTDNCTYMCVKHDKPYSP